MVRKHVHLTVAQAARLPRVAAREGRSQGAVIWQALEAFLAGRHRTNVRDGILGIVGAGRSRAGRLSSDVDGQLYDVPAGHRGKNARRARGGS
jgi:hypothetical protein